MREKGTAFLLGVVLKMNKAHTVLRTQKDVCALPYYGRTRQKSPVLHRMANTTKMVPITLFFASFHERSAVNKKNLFERKCVLFGL